MDVVIKIGMLVVFFGIMIGVGLYCRKHSTDVDGFVLGGRSVGLAHGLYRKRATTASVWASFIFSTVVMLANIFFKSAFPALLQSPIHAGVFCMLCGLVIVPVVSLLTKPPQKRICGAGILLL